jgi:hypothetical protein
MYTTKMKNGKSIIMKSIIYAMLFISIIAIIPACKKDNKDKAHLSVSMTDAPANYNAVMVDVQGVEVMGSDGTTVLLNTKAGIYNLLDFTNGVDTLIASGDLNAGTISQIRLILGPNNSVMVDNVVYHLSTPSAMQSGLKLQIHQKFEAGVSYYILLDFDASQSIVLTGNGEYQLKPVIRTIDAAINGSIKGHISPISLGTIVTASSKNIVYSTVVNANGEFVLAGLPAGTYSITVTPALPLLPITITGKTVTVGVSTDLGIIVF